MEQGIETHHRALSPLPVESDDDNPSILYSLLPKLVRTRLKRISSLRRPMNQDSRSSPTSPNGSRRSSANPSEPTSPPPEYRSRVSVSEPISDVDGFEDEETSQASPLLSSGTVDEGSGIRWDFSEQGLSLLNIAAQENCIRLSGRRRDVTSLSRHLYVHGLTYLLRGLPPNLSPEEKMSIGSAIPTDVLKLSAVNVSSTEVIQVRDARLVDLDSKQRPSLLHRMLVACIVQMFMAFHVLLPYIKVFFAAAYKYERQHRISTRILASTVDTIGGMIQQAIQLGNAVCKMNDGKVGQAVREVVVWWVKGVSGGIHQGVGEGLVILGVDSLSSQQADWERK